MDNQNTIQEKIIYLAGIIDGEGWIGFNKSLRKGQKESKLRYFVVLVVVNTNKDLMAWLQSNFGGSVHKRKMHSEKWEQSYDWRICCTQAINLIELVKPYLIIKRSHAEIAVSYKRLLDMRVNTYNGKYVFSRQLREDIYQCYKSLNGKGPKSVETNTSEVNDILTKIESELTSNGKNRISDDLVACSLKE